MNVLGLAGKFLGDHWERIRLYLFYLALIYILVLVLLYFFQNRLIFFPQKIKESHSKNAVNFVNQYSNVEEIRIHTPDKVMLHGWLIKNTSAGKSPLLIYYGGNAEELSYLLYEATEVKDISLLLLNYRGYGLSQGTPNERNLCQDAELVYDQMVKRPDVDPEKVILLGRSIGSGVAVYLAGKRKISGIILVTPFDSLLSVAQERLKLVPVSFILRDKFDSIGAVLKIKAPLLTLIAKNDAMVPPRHAIKLVNQWGGPKEVKIFEGVGHNTIQDAPLYWESINEFIKRVNH